jgi:predicted DNA-binding transcriptional regulator AlpA
MGITLLQRAAIHTGDAMQKLKLSIDEICGVTGESRASLYKAINCGDLRTFVVGKRRFAKPIDVQSWVDFLQSQSDKGCPVAYQAREKAVV